jgi:hypothetical protein
MPSLGLALGVDYQSIVKSLRKRLLDSGAVMALIPQYATGISRGINSPPTNPMVDYTGLGNNALLQGFGFVPNSGYDLFPFVNSNGVDVGYETYSPNGDFSNGITGYTSITDLGYTIESNEMTINNLTANAASFKLIYRTAGVVTGKRYYVAIQMKTNSTSDGLVSTGNSGSISKYHSGSNNYEKLSLITTATATGIGDFRPLATTRTGDITANPIKLKEFIIINLTDNPLIIALETQLGRQLTALECDRLFPFVATTGISKIANRVVLSADGLDDRGVLARNYGNIASNQDFALCWGGLMPSVINFGYIFSNGLDSGTNQALAATIASTQGAVAYYINGATTGLTTGNGMVMPNEFYDFRFIRKSGIVTLESYNSKGDKTVLFSTANASALTWQPNTRLFCRSASADGLTNGAFLKLGLAWCTLHIGTGVVNVDKTIDRIARDYRTVV